MAAAIEKFVELVTLHCQSVQCVNFGHLILYIFLCLYYHIIIKRAQNTLRTAFCELKSPCLFTYAGSGLSLAAARTDTPRVWLVVCQFVFPRCPVPKMRLTYINMQLQ